ncbi:MAG: hypothetical protein BJ554DRAFT_5948 [Olpidium bornovanus]|uniref:Uncharacterized protein n=1 Tax=Olpidium bornovanus TaxID=278681 RepID=A0A8H7ZYK5_9FUNG|nr:MAG: hypothetical protein BJ554DRAFT_5948 [Olpidium bornovanus]
MCFSRLLTGVSAAGARSRCPVAPTTLLDLSWLSSLLRPSPSASPSTRMSAQRWRMTSTTG